MLIYILFRSRRQVSSLQQVLISMPSPPTNRRRREKAAVLGESPLLPRFLQGSFSRASMDLREGSDRTSASMREEGRKGETGPARGEDRGQAESVSFDSASAFLPSLTPSQDRISRCTIQTSKRTPRRLLSDSSTTASLRRQVSSGSSISLNPRLPSSTYRQLPRSRRRAARFRRMAWLTEMPVQVQAKCLCRARVR